MVTVTVQADVGSLLHQLGSRRGEEEGAVGSLSPLKEGSPVSQ